MNSQNSSPLSNPTFRTLWLASVASNIGTWIQDVGTAWLMTTLAPSPLMVALVQSSATAPIFFLALPAGALADIVDRRKLLLLAQLWMCVAAGALALFTYFQWTDPISLLVVTFSLGIGFALHAPAWQAVVPELVPSEQLDAAVTLSGIGINVARAVGPALGGLLVSMAGPAFAFMLNAISFLVVSIVLFRWKPEKRTGTTESRNEPLAHAIFLGMRYVQHNRPFQSVLIRTLAFIFFGSALWAHLPLIAKQQLNTGASGYGLLLGMIGLGAVATAFVLPKIRKKIRTNHLVIGSTAGLSIALACMTTAKSVFVMTLILLPVGAFWVATLSSLNVSAQISIANWAKARALAVYLVFFFGGMSLGSIWWGILANYFGIQASLWVAAFGLAAAMFITLPFKLDSVSPSSLLPSLHWPTPLIHAANHVHSSGPIVVTVEYRVGKDHEEEFTTRMKSLREARIRTGAYQWTLIKDVAEPLRWLEVFYVSTWAEHERQHQRVSMSDKNLQTEIAALQVDTDFPKVNHWTTHRV